MVPSEICRFIDQYFPWANGPAQDTPIHGTEQNKVSTLVEMIEELPRELLDLPGTKSPSFRLAMGETKSTLNAWRAGRNVAGIAPLPDLGGRNPVAVIREVLGSLPDSVPMLDAGSALDKQIAEGELIRRRVRDGAIDLERLEDEQDAWHELNLRILGVISGGRYSEEYASSVELGLLPSDGSPEAERSVLDQSVRLRVSALRSVMRSRIPIPGAAALSVTTEDERRFMAMAVAEARKCVPEDEKPRPKVGAVVVKDGRVLAVAHRGELAPGDHAEFTALEKKLRDAVVAGATIYTTLEPCTTRKHPKVACAIRLGERRVARVVIGMIDPNPKIRGDGQIALREGGIAIALFPADLMAEIEELNRDFTRAFRSPAASQSSSAPGVPPGVGRIARIDEVLMTNARECPECKGRSGAAVMFRIRFPDNGTGQRICKKCYDERMATGAWREQPM